MNQIESVLSDIEYIQSFYKRLISILPSFDITSSDILPYGLKPHTRSISWPVEQVITQQSKFHASDLEVNDA